MTDKEKYIIEKHLAVATKLLKSGCNSKVKSDLDDIFLQAITEKVWNEYREKHGIEGMRISPYYNNDELIKE